MINHPEIHHFLWHSTSPLLFGALHAVNKPFPNWPLDMGWFIFFRTPWWMGWVMIYHWNILKLCLRCVKFTMIYHFKLCRKDAEKSSQKPLNFPCDWLGLISIPSIPTVHGQSWSRLPQRLVDATTPDRCHSSPHWARGWHWVIHQSKTGRIYEKIKVKPND